VDATGAGRLVAQRVRVADMTYRCPVCGTSQPGDSCTRDDCGFTPDPGDPVQIARDWLARIRNQLNKGDDQ
jgi:hypothetical protein